MKRLSQFLCLILLCSCAQKPDFIAEVELQQSRWKIEDETNSKFACFKTILVDVDTSYTIGQPKNIPQRFYEDFLKLKDLRDSIINIKESITKKEWLSILLKFQKKVIDIKGTERTRAIIEDDLKSIKEHINLSQELKSTEVYKHIIVRWTDETYNGFMKNACIDTFEGHQMPCKLIH